MKKICISLCIIFFSQTARSQGPVAWQYTVKKVEDRVFELRILATVNKPWHIYSQRTPVGGPRPTNITFSKNPLLQFQGKIKEEGNMEIYREDVFGVNVYAYAGKVEFVQKIKLKSVVKTNVNGSIDYMACTNQQCLPPATIKFSVTLE